jgi:riboflavin biosynthesis pyrimidine reductase
MKIFTNTAISLDGRINTFEGRFTQLGTAQDHARMSRLRAQADAVLAGGASYRMWPHPALPDAADANVAIEPRPWNVIVSRSMKLPYRADETDFVTHPQTRPLFLTRAASVPSDLEAAYAAYDGAEPDLPVSWMLETLRQRGIQNLLIEAGGDLIFQFLAADVIDEINLTLCPLVIGGPAPSLAGGAGFAFADMRRFRLLRCEQVGDELFLTYARKTVAA